VQRGDTSPAAARRWAAALALTLALAAAPCYALFGDDEARKAILDLRDRVAQIEKDQAARNAEFSQRLDKLESRLDVTVQAFQRGQSESAGQLDALRQEIARLRGSIEQIANDVATLQKRDKDLYTDLDARMRKLEPTSVTVEGRSVQVEREEQAAYETALAQFRTSDFRSAIGGFTAFLARYPQSAYAPAAQFWLGSSYYAIKDYKSAISSQQGLLERFPDSPRVPDALLNIAASQVESNDKKGARVTLNRIVSEFPDSDTARLAKERLAGLGSTKP
jgi:tol-pal system protein YbgF